MEKANEIKINKDAASVVKNANHVLNFCQNGLRISAFDAAITLHLARVLIEHRFQCSVEKLEFERRTDGKKLTLDEFMKEITEGYEDVGREPEQPSGPIKNHSFEDPTAH